ncbi:Ubiquinone biosynthesis O-methyltransferase [Rosistilla carotiformis]|uniref:Ubiquinone biosynthesis O-methyltransferase n=1 Tax=Rosistilla carotiformis TaxID=2528017 RepID=A0A518JQ10_9BACT|nr:methyltransferase domain-containing protein [Rosistilla carotiformis]QDV67623.1 Ubiquinone biosynthesis O-methyltransferase [Rosistilla carotiformis]
MVKGWLKERRREPEWMDQPDLDPQLHHDALAGLTRVNAISGTTASLWGPISKLANSSGEPLRVLDVASGGGDVAIGLAQQAAKSGLPVQVDGCDMSDVALAYAQQRADTLGLNVNFLRADVLSDPLPTGYDVICCSLFLHHFDPPEVIQLLTAMRDSGARMIVISDLLRTRLGYVMCWAGIRLLTRSRMCHVDGPLSVQGAFTRSELRELADRAGLREMVLKNVWPQRLLMTWER